MPRQIDVLVRRQFTDALAGRGNDGIGQRRCGWRNARLADADLPVVCNAVVTIRGYPLKRPRTFTVATTGFSSRRHVRVAESTWC